jgi:hypothetical protein
VPNELYSVIISTYSSIYILIRTEINTYFIFDLYNNTSSYKYNNFYNTYKHKSQDQILTRPFRRLNLRKAVNKSIKSNNFTYLYF